MAMRQAQAAIFGMIEQQASMIAYTRRFVF